MIPLYGCMAHGGRLISMDDEAVVKDLASVAGSGGNTYTPYLVSSLQDIANTGGYGRFRRAVQDVEHDGSATVEMTPLKDGQDTGQTITRSLAIGDNPIVVAPFALSGTRFQLRVEITAFSAKVELGKAQLYIVGRRGER